MKQTAVEWFWLNLTDDLIGDLAPEKILKIYNLIEQAKAMEKEQIIEAYNTSFRLRDKPYSTADKYYNETYESNT